MMTLFRSPRTAVHLVTVLEEMPVQETADGIAELRAARAARRRRGRQPGPPARPATTTTWPPRRAGKVDQRQVAADLTAAGLDRDRRPGRRPARRGPRPRRAPRARGRPARAWSTDARRADVRAAAAGRRHRPRRPLRAGRPAPRPGAGMTTSAPAGRARSPGAAGPAAPAPATSTPCSTTARTGIIVCCGSGGVGKTTTSAALALRAAERGRKVVVLTIDPARRLAQSMGIEALDNTPRPVAGVGADAGRGRRARRDDARHEAHLRRGGREPGQPGEGASRSWRTPSTSRCRARSRGRRSTWRWRSSARSTPTPSATAPTT